MKSFPIIFIVFSLVCACSNKHTEYVEDQAPVPAEEQGARDAAVVSYAAIQEEIGLARDWVSPAHIDRQDNLMRIMFHANGVLEFVNGFAAHNPARWEYVEEGQALIMHLPALDVHVDTVLRDYKGRGIIKDYSYDDNTITYWFRRGTRNLIFFGFSFNAVR